MSGPSPSPGDDVVRTDDTESIVPESNEASVVEESAVDPLEDTVVGEPFDGSVEPGGHVVVVGYDAWTAPVLAELEGIDVSVSVITRRDAIVDRLAHRPVDVVGTDELDEACFHDAEIERADAVLVATLDDQLNVLAVLTVMNVDESMHVVTFAGEEEDVPKLRAAGADRVVSLGQAVGELLVEVALSERAVDDVVAQLLGEGA